MDQHQQLIDVAKKFLPELRERSGEIDSQRQIPQDLAGKMAAATAPAPNFT